MTGTPTGFPDPVPERAAITDDQLMASVKAGSVAAFDQLYDRYCHRAYRVARSVCRDEGRAQEAVQETFISIWRTRASYEDRGNVRPFVLAVARFRAIDIARRHGPHAARRASDDSLDSLCAPGGVDEQAEATAQTRRMRSLLGGLPDNQREAITLAFYGQLTHLEIAAHLGIPLGTVKGRIRLGLMRLRGDIASERAGL
ncbi:MAG TPA: sigma-70 family RNA polymerase sigma factor [Solirubrobacteraceae bacterium]|jgi:RNA polymerase sigma-70 factor (ECF subfamily)|nr:sigma-70 family RNA polymerase sigma factor [Solirubrobacteraceae bacterium]